MPLRSARLTGDPFLESRLNGTDRIFSGRDGLTVMRLQSALLDVGLSVGPAGTDGIFGSDTGAAVTTFKTGHGSCRTTRWWDRAQPKPWMTTCSSTRPVSTQYSGSSVRRWLIIGWSSSSPASWSPCCRPRWTRGVTCSGASPQTRSNRADPGHHGQQPGIDLREPFLAVADPVQDGKPAEQFIDDAIIAERAHGVTVEFNVNSEPRSFILINDEVILGRAATSLSGSPRRAPETLLGTAGPRVDPRAQPRPVGRAPEYADTDTEVFVDPALAQTRTALTGIPTAVGLQSFVEEVVARHVHWIVLQELAGTPGSIAVLQLGAGSLAAAAHFYFFERRRTWDVNDYGQGVFAQGNAAKFAQLAAFLRRCAAQSFSTDFDADNASTQAFLSAAQFCDDEASNPTGCRRPTAASRYSQISSSRRWDR